jgi:putative transposase
MNGPPERFLRSKNPQTKLPQQYHADMPSGLKRYQTSGHDHFITFTCYHRFPHLDDDHARTLFEQTLETLRQRHQFYLYGYVLMPDHVHLLLSEPKRQLLSDTLRTLKTQTSRQLKGARQQFWQTRYYDRNIITQTEFVEKLRYIHRNPVKEALVENPEDWPWSSYRHWQTGERGRLEIESHWTWAAREKSALP